MPECECLLCKNRKQVPIPNDLLDRLASGDVVIFAGAGISTENRDWCRTTFYDQIKHELGEAADLSFPELMSKYCSQADGRIKLVQRIKSRIEYFRGFRGFYAFMTQFHRAMRPLFMITDVVTTNWDDFLEIEAGYEPYVYDQDLALLSSSSKRVIKLHGSISNYGSLVATSDDYKKSLRRLRNGAIGAYLKNLLISKTVVYMGYSLRDPNYSAIARELSKLMGPFARSAYFVSPYIDYDHLNQLDLNLIPIETDAAFFLENFRTHYNNSESLDKIISDGNFDECEDFLYHVNEYHSYTADKFLKTKNQKLILGLAYQDGLQDALMRIKDRRKTGEYYSHNHVHKLIHGYQAKVSAYKKKRDLWNACYCQGYQNGLLFLLLCQDGARPPMIDLLFERTSDSTPKVLRLPRKRVPAYVAKELDRLQRVVARGDLIPEHMPYV